MTGGPTRLVRFRAEWTQELPVDADFLEGGRIEAPGREFVVRQVLDNSDPRRRDGRPLWRGFASSGELRDADLLVALAPHRITPEAIWRVRCTLRQPWMRGTSVMLEHRSRTLDGALDAVTEWAERLDADPVEGRIQLGDALSGSAELVSVEPGESDIWGRLLVHVDIRGPGERAPDWDGAMDALAAFCEEAERLYGAE